MPIKCWIVDDEPASHRAIELALQAETSFEITDNFYALDELPAQAPSDVDVLFLDIEMPRQNGFALFDIWTQDIPLVVFVTAYNQYAIKAFEKAAFDYLLKPIEQVRIDDTLKRIKVRLQEQEVLGKQAAVKALFTQLNNNESNKGISVKTDKGLFRLKQKDIHFTEAVGDFIAVHLAKETLIVRDSLKRFSTELDAAFFYRVHKSYVVNKSHVERFEKGKFGDGVLHLHSGKSVKLSRRFKACIPDIICQ